MIHCAATESTPHDDHLCQKFGRLDGPSVIVSLKALGLLMAASLAGSDEPGEAMSASGLSTWVRSSAAC